MKSIVPIDEWLEYSLQTKIQEKLNELRRLIRESRGGLKSALYSFRLSSVQDAYKKANDVLAIQTDTTRDVINVVADICELTMQLGYTVNLDAFDKENIEERYYSDGYLQCFSDIYRNFQELRGRL